ncbi:MAG TPA: RDD family protein [Phaeodactylibacter sp.]|nr:RDD family protein [Phaeodactylibacter sp.]
MKTIDIRTTQNVTIEYELATLQDRILAFFIDLVIVYISSIIILFLVAGGFREVFSNIGQYQGVIVFSFFVFYQLFSEIIADGQSWGKKTVGIKVVRLDGQEPNLSDYLLRSVFYIIDVLFSFGVVALLLISSSAKGQRLGDMTANTTVIRVRFDLRFRLDDILKISSLDDYEPQFPEVRKLSEQDMLLVKSIITRSRLYKNKAHREAVNEVVQHIKEELDLEKIPPNKVEFLKTLIRDYIVLTR